MDARNEVIYPPLAMKIAYLCSENTLPDSSVRRADAFEHDLIMSRLREGFEVHNASIVPVAWDGCVDWSTFDAALIGTAWDYWDKFGLFLETLDTVQKSIPLFNSAEIVRWNARKTYLRDLDKRGAALIPTIWLDNPNDLRGSDIFNALDCDTLVLKRQVGGGAVGQYRVRRDEPLPSLEHPMMAQPFLSTIEREGELSFIFIDGELSHALLKRAAAGDYRIQSLYGGTETAIAPTAADVSAAKSVLETLDETPLYARVDMLRNESGDLLLMELELIEPYLYPVEGPRVGYRFADAVLKRL